MKKVLIGIVLGLVSAVGLYIGTSWVELKNRQIEALQMSQRQLQSEFNKLHGEYDELVEKVRAPEKYLFADAGVKDKQNNSLRRVDLIDALILGAIKQSKK